MDKFTKINTEQVELKIRKQLEFSEKYDLAKDFFQKFLKENLVNGTGCKMCRTKDKINKEKLSFLT